MVVQGDDDTRELVQTYIGLLNDYDGGLVDAGIVDACGCGGWLDGTLFYGTPNNDGSSRGLSRWYQYQYLVYY